MKGKKIQETDVMNLYCQNKTNPEQKPNHSRPSDMRFQFQEMSKSIFKQ